MRDHGIPAVSWWGNTVPTTGPTGTTTTWVGAVFRITVPGRIAGLRLWDATNAAPASSLAMLLDDSFQPSLYAGVRGIQMAANQAAKWHQIWFRPWYRPAVGVDLFTVAMYVGGGFFRNNNALSAGPVTRNGIQFRNSFQSTALDLTNATPTLNLNANAVDVLFYPD